MIEETWKDIEGYEGLYQVSSFGRVKKKKFRNNKYNINKEEILTNKTTGKYNFVRLTDENSKTKQHYIHKLVAETFLNKKNFKSMPDEDKNTISLNKLEINHKNEIKTDNRIENLEWCTHKYNMNYNGLNKKIGKKHCKKIKQISSDNVVVKIWNSIDDAQKKLNINNISKCCCHRKNYKTAGGYRWEFINE